MLIILVPDTKRGLILTDAYLPMEGHTYKYTHMTCMRVETNDLEGH